MADKPTSRSRAGRQPRAAGQQARAPRPQHSARGEQARQRLKDAAAQCLEECGYHQMRIVDVTRRAGVATGLFYHYFSDLKALVTEVLEDFIARFENTPEIERDVARGDWFGRILAHYKLVVGSYASCPGLMRCVTQFTDQDAEFRALWRRSYQRQLQQLVVALPRVYAHSELSDGERWLVVSALGDIGEGMLREYYIEQSPEVRGFQLSEDEMAEWLAVVFYRGLFLSNPPREQLQHAVRISSLSRAQSRLESAS